MPFKVLRSILILPMLLLFTISASASWFIDVDAADPYAEAIEYVHDAGIMFGRDTGDFAPNGTVTRGEMAAVICRLLAIDTTIYKESGFTDCKGHWADGYIANVASRGIVKGYGNGMFGPNDTVTYEQAVTMVIRALGYEAQALEQGKYPYGYLAFADSIGLLNRISSAPNTAFLRGEVAQIVYNGRNIHASIPKPNHQTQIPAVLRENNWDGLTEYCPEIRFYPDRHCELTLNMAEWMKTVSATYEVYTAADGNRVIKCDLGTTDLGNGINRVSSVVFFVETWDGESWQFIGEDMGLTFFKQSFSAGNSGMISVAQVKMKQPGYAGEYSVKGVNDGRTYGQLIFRGGGYGTFFFDFLGTDAWGRQICEGLGILCSPDGSALAYVAEDPDDLSQCFILHFEPRDNAVMLELTASNIGELQGLVGRSFLCE